MPTKPAVAAALFCFLLAGSALAEEAQSAAKAETAAKAEAGEVEPVAIAEPGTWSLLAYGSASFGDEAGEVYQGRFGGERHFEHGFAIEISGALGFYDADPIGKEDEESGIVTGFDALIRWYFHRRDNWAMYADVGLGAEWFESEFPTHDGTSFNFEPQAGMGFTRRMGPRSFFFAGARWHHLSNANLVGDDNRGYDGAMPYFGFSWYR